MAPKGDIDNFNPGKITGSVTIPVGGWGIDLYTELHWYSNELDPQTYPDDQISTAKLGRSFATIILERLNQAAGKGGYEGALDAGRDYVQMSVTSKEKTFLLNIVTALNIPEAIEEMSKVEARGWY